MFFLSLAVVALVYVPLILVAVDCKPSLNSKAALLLEQVLRMRGGLGSVEELDPTAHTTTCGSLNGSSATAALTIGVQLAEGFKMVPITIMILVWQFPEIGGP